MDENALSKVIIGAAIEVHRQLGPGLLESAYKECLAFELGLQRIPFERQKPIPHFVQRVATGLRISSRFAGRRPGNSGTKSSG